MLKLSVIKSELPNVESVDFTKKHDVCFLNKQNTGCNNFNRYESSNPDDEEAYDNPLS